MTAQAAPDETRPTPPLYGFEYVTTIEDQELRFLGMAVHAINMIESNVSRVAAERSVRYLARRFDGSPFMTSVGSK